MPRLQDPVIEKADERFERVVALLAPHVTLILVLALGAVLEGSHAAQEDIDQVVVQPVILMRDEGRQMQVSFVRAAPGELKDLRFDDAVGIVLNAVGAEIQMSSTGFSNRNRSCTNFKSATRSFTFEGLVDCDSFFIKVSL